MDVRVVGIRLEVVLYLGWILAVLALVVTRLTPLSTPDSVH